MYVYDFWEFFIFNMFCKKLFIYQVLFIFFFCQEVEDNEDSDEDLEEMVEQLEQVFINSLRRFLRKRVFLFFFLRDLNIILKIDRGGIFKEVGQEMMKDGKQVIVYNRREDGSLKGS